MKLPRDLDVLEFKFITAGDLGLAMIGFLFLLVYSFFLIFRCVLPTFYVPFWVFFGARRRETSPTVAILRSLRKMKRPGSPFTATAASPAVVCV